MNGLVKLGVRALSTSASYQSFSPTALGVKNSFTPLPRHQVPALPRVPSFASPPHYSSARWNWTRFPGPTSRVSYTAQQNFASNFSTEAGTYAPVSYWESRIAQNPFYLDLEAEDLKHLNSLSIWIKKNGIDVYSISFPHEKVQKKDVKNLLKAISNYHLDLLGLGIGNPAKQFSKIEIISEPDLETIAWKGNEMQKGTFPTYGIHLEHIPLKDERYLNLIADQIVNNTEPNFVVLIFSDKYWRYTVRG